MLIDIFSWITRQIFRTSWFFLRLLIHIVQYGSTVAGSESTMYLDITVEYRKTNLCFDTPRGHRHDVRYRRNTHGADEHVPGLSRGRLPPSLPRLVQTVLQWNRSGAEGETQETKMSFWWHAASYSPAAGTRYDTLWYSKTEAYDVG